MSARKNTKHFRFLASTSILGLALAATPVTFSVDWQGADVALQTAEAKSCFTAETLVLMADGSEKRIKDIRIGDCVMGGEGRVNRVVAVERPRLAGRRLFAFNGGAPFVTAEHPFLTPAGWKALDPIATAEENPALTVASLTRGDLLTVAQPQRHGAMGNLALAVELATSLVPLQRIESVDADPRLQVYNLLLDGDHTYIANGFVVHNKGGGGDRGGNDRGGDDRGGDDRGGRDGGEGGERGDDGGESGEHGGGEAAEADDDGDGHGRGRGRGRGRGGDDFAGADDEGEHGEGGESAEDEDEDDHQGRGRGRGRGRGGDDLADDSTDDSSGAGSTDGSAESEGGTEQVPATQEASATEDQRE